MTIINVKTTLLRDIMCVLLLRMDSFKMYLFICQPWKETKELLPACGSMWACCLRKGDWGSIAIRRLFHIVTFLQQNINMYM